MCMASLSQQEGSGEGGFGRFFDLPSANFSYHSAKNCDVGEDSDKDSKADTSDAGLDVSQATATLSTQQLSEVLYVYRSWTAEEHVFMSPHSQYVAPPASRNPSHLHLVLRGLKLTRATSYQFDTKSLTLVAVRGAVMRDAEEKPHTVNFFPFLYGPFDSSQWNNIAQYQRVVSSERPFTKNLLELLMTTPNKDYKGIPVYISPVAFSSIATPISRPAEQVFPTIQFLVSGCGVHLEPTLLDFLRNLTPHTPLCPEESPPDGPSAPLGGPPQPPHTLTPTVSVEEPAWDPEPVQAGENKILAETIIYAIRVCGSS